MCSLICVGVLLLFIFLLLLQCPRPSLSSTNSEGNALLLLHALRSRLSDPNNAVVLHSWDPTLFNINGSSIPEEHVLDFYHHINILQPNIPNSFSNFNSLQFLDVCNNHLSGTIPLEGNFGSFTPESFENNTPKGPERKGLVPYDFGCYERKVKRIQQLISLDCYEEAFFTLAVSSIRDV